MPGPFVRQYGFPNHERIFGKREPQHGTDDSASGPGEPAASESVPSTAGRVEETKTASRGTNSEARDES